MKVAYLLGSLNRGGTETMVLDEFRNANKAPYEMVCIHRKGGPYLDDYYATGIKMIQCAPKRLGILRYLWQLRKHLLQENVTIVHAQQSIDCIYAWLATIGTGIRVIETFHGYDFELRPIDKFIIGMSIHIADRICFVSCAQRDYYVDAYPIRNTKKLQVVYNGIDFTKLDSAKPSLEFADQPQRIRLAMVGNFVSGRSQNIIAKSIHLLRQRGVVDFEFYFIGGKSEREPWRYEECVKYCEENGLDNVHFLGGRGDVPSLLKVMDGFVYSTDHDTFGIAVVEAMVAGLPVVVNDWEVMKEVCGEENGGIWYYKTGDSNAAADKIEELLENLLNSKKAGEANATNIREKYSIDQHIERLCAVYGVEGKLIINNEQLTE